MIATLEIAWLAGLLEGEGSFGYYKGSPTVQIQSTDVDVVERVTEMMGGKPYLPWKPKGKEHYKLVYKCSVHGAKAIGWMMTLFLFLGERRQAKIAEVIEEWKASDRWPRASRGRRFAALCHPDRQRLGKGMCKQCYMRWWRKKTGRDGTYYRNKAALA